MKQNNVKVIVMKIVDYFTPRMVFRKRLVISLDKPRYAIVQVCQVCQSTDSSSE